MVLFRVFAYETESVNINDDYEKEENGHDQVAVNGKAEIVEAMNKYRHGKRKEPRAIESGVTAFERGGFRA